MQTSTPRILLTRLSAIGDCVHTMPLVGALRERFPQATIVWVTQAAPASLLAGYPGLDEVLVVPRNWLQSPREVLRIRRELRARRFDWAVDPQSLTKSALLGWLSGARCRIGFAAPQGRELSLWLNNIQAQCQREHVVEKYLELLRPIVGDHKLTPRFELPVRSLPSIERLLAQPPWTRDFAVLNPGAGWDSKLWLPERFAAVARHLAEQHRLPSLVVWAGDRERTWAECIVTSSAGSATLAPETNLPELAELLRRAKLCVACDTGPLHLAAAVGTDCVGLYGSTRPSVCGPYGPRHASVQAYYQEGRARERRRAENNAMQAIAVSQVTTACDRVLARAASARCGSGGVPAEDRDRPDRLAG
jgi:lipopolysaccharide heptosyltransferase I